MRLPTLVAASTLVFISTHRTSSGLTISPSWTFRQSLPANSGWPCFPVGGLFKSSCRACCESDGWRCARGDPGVPRSVSTKLERWFPLNCGLGGGRKGASLGLVVMLLGGDRGVWFAILQGNISKSVGFASVEARLGREVGAGMQIGRQTKAGARLKDRCLVCERRCSKHFYQSQFARRKVYEQLKRE